MERALALGAPVDCAMRSSTTAMWSAGALGAMFVEELAEITGKFRWCSRHGVPSGAGRAEPPPTAVISTPPCPGLKGASRGPSVHSVGPALYHADRPCRPSGGHRHHRDAVAGRSLLVEDGGRGGKTVAIKEPAEALAYRSQTTLSIDDTIGIIGVLRRRSPNIHGPRKEDICYATTNRQQFGKGVANRCDLMLVIGARTRRTRGVWSKWAHGLGCSNASGAENGRDRLGLV